MANSGNTRTEKRKKLACGTLAEMQQTLASLGVEQEVRLPIVSLLSDMFVVIDKAVSANVLPPALKMLTVIQPQEETDPPFVVSEFTSRVSEAEHYLIREVLESIVQTSCTTAPEHKRKRLVAIDLKPEYLGEAVRVLTDYREAALRLSSKPLTAFVEKYMQPMGHMLSELLQIWKKAESVHGLQPAPYGFVLTRRVTGSPYFAVRLKFGDEYKLSDLSSTESRIRASQSTVKSRDSKARIVDLG